MSFSHFDEDGARTSHRTHCCIGARRATHCATGDDNEGDDDMWWSDHVQKGHLVSYHQKEEVVGRLGRSVTSVEKKICCNWNTSY